MKKQENSFNETMKVLLQNMQVFTHTISNVFQIVSQIFTSTYSSPVHSYSQLIHTTQNYHVFPNYPMN